MFGVSLALLQREFYHIAPLHMIRLAWLVISLQLIHSKYKPIAHCLYHCHCEWFGNIQTLTRWRMRIWMMGKLTLWKKIPMHYPKPNFLCFDAVSISKRQILFVQVRLCFVSISNVLEIVQPMETFRMKSINHRVRHTAVPLDCFISWPIPNMCQLDKANMLSSMDLTVISVIFSLFHCCFVFQLSTFRGVLSWKVWFFFSANGRFDIYRHTRVVILAVVSPMNDWLLNECCKCNEAGGDQTHARGIPAPTY